MANHKHKWVRIEEAKDDYRVQIAAGKKTAVFMYLPVPVGNAAPGVPQAASDVPQTSVKILKRKLRNSCN